MTITKHAGWFDFMNRKTLTKVVTNPFVMAAASPVIGAGVDAGISHIKSMLRVRGKAKAYKNMLEENPALRKKPVKDTQKFFNTLYNANPSLAKDPLVASGWVHTQMEQQVPGVPHAGVVEGVSTLTKIRQQMRGPSSSSPGRFQSFGQEIGRIIPRAHDEGLAKRTRELHKSEEAVSDRIKELRALKGR